MTKARQHLAGSDRAAVQDSKCLGPVDPGETLRVVVTLRRRGAGELEDLAQRITHEQAEPLSREAFAERFAVAPEDFAKLEAFAREYRLSIERQDLTAAKAVLSAPSSTFKPRSAWRFLITSIPRWAGSAAGSAPSPFPRKSPTS